MTIAVMSDLHDNLVAWKVIVEQLKKDQISRLINCGDAAAPDMLADMARTFPGQIDTVFGNVADRETEKELVTKIPNICHHGDVADISLEKRRIFFTHFPKIALTRVATGKYDLVCYGHDHLKRAEKIGRTLLLNPGTAGGMFQYPSYALVDLTNLSYQFIEIKL